MPPPDAKIHPTATGEAKNTVDAHQADTDVIFYSGWFCPFVQRSWISLEEKGIPYTYKEENPYHKDAEFLKVSPKGLVPALLYKGEALPESLIICEFLEDAFPDKKPLLPKDPFKKARVRLAIDNITKSVIPNNFKLMQSQDKESQDKAREGLVGAFKKFVDDSLDGSISKGGFFAGEQLTLADTAIIPFLMRLYILEENRGFNKSDVGEAFEKYFDKVANLESVRKTTSEKQYYSEIYGRYLRDEAQSEAAKATRGGSVIP